MAGMEPKKRSFNNITVIIPSAPSLFLLATCPKLSKDPSVSTPFLYWPPSSIYPLSSFTLPFDECVSSFLYTFDFTKIVRSKGLLDFERPYVESWVKHFYFSLRGLFWKRVVGEVVEKIVSKLGYMCTECVYI